jgi:hypothetical protein
VSVRWLTCSSLGLLSLTIHGEKLVGPEVYGEVGAALAAHPALTSLELYGNSIDDATAEGLVAVGPLLIAALSATAHDTSHTSRLLSRRWP